MKEELNITKKEHNMTIAELENGTKVQYDACSKNKDAYADNDRTTYHYLGKGYIYSVNGTIQTKTQKYHFWNMSIK
jgi:hypothetical protein